MVHNPKSGNSYKYDERDCCTEREEHCWVTKQEWSSIKCAVCEKFLHQNCIIIFSETRIEYGHNNDSKYLEKRTKCTKK
jgi:predicted metal-dependent HD superfamily phosphohydrolase